MRVIVIGGGPAGMISAFQSASMGNDTILIEKNEKLGKKLYITGKGRCNLTNQCSPTDFFENVVNGKRFLSSSIYSFTPDDLMDLIESYGLKLKVERGRRVFPVSDKSSDVIKTLSYMLNTVGVKVNLNETVKSIQINDGAVVSVKTDLATYSCDKVIVATGGISYPSTGSTGDGYTFAKKVGHKVIEPKPSLCSLKIKGGYASKLAGLTLKNVTLHIEQNGKTICDEFGEMLFTYSGISGPIVLTASTKVNRLNLESLTAYIDLKPALDFGTLDDRIIKDFATFNNKQVKNSLDMLLPSSLIPIVLQRWGIDENKKVAEVNKVERQKLLHILKHFDIELYALGGFEEAVITSGGVSVDEINPKTMESKLVKGLYFAGEVIDVDALTGGYNLQIAFATGIKAGNN